MRLPIIKVQLERIVGIEPTLTTWQAAVLPLNYIRVQIRDAPAYSLVEV